MNDCTFDRIENLPIILLNLINSCLSELKKEYKREEKFLNSEERFYSGFESPIKDHLVTKIAEILSEKSFISNS